MTPRGLRVIGLALAFVGCGESRPPPDVVQLEKLMMEGDSIYGQAEFAAAREVWLRALPVASGMGDTIRRARILTSLGLAAWRLGEYSQARSLGEEALALKQAAGLTAELFRSHNALGLLASDEGRLDDALAHYRSAADAARAAQDEVSLAKSANNVALIQVARGQFAAARAGYLEAIAVGRRAGEALIEGRALNNLGALEIQLGDPGAAVTALTGARALLRDAGDRAGELNALGQLGTAFDALGEPRLALAALDTALALARQQEFRQEEASNLELIGGIHRQAGDYQRALHLFESANLINTQLSLRVEEGTNRRQTAEIHAAMGRPDLARGAALAALSHHQAAQVPLEQLRDLLLLARLAGSEPGRSLERDGHLRAAEMISRQIDARAARVEVALARATQAESSGEDREVIAVLQRARSDLEGGGFGDEWFASALRLRAYARLNRLDSATLAGREAVVAVERVRGGFGSALLRSAYTMDKQRVYTDLVEVLLRLGRTGEAFEVADAARSRALLEHLAAAAGDSIGPRTTTQSLGRGADLLRQIDTLVSQRDALEETPAGERSPGFRNEVRDLGVRLVQARSEYETLMIEAAERDAAGMALLGGSRIRAHAVQQALRPGEAMLEFLVTPSSLVTFIVTRTAIHSLSASITRDDLARRIRLARDLLGDRGSPPESAHPVLGALHSLLIDPVERAGYLSGIRRLIVVPHSLLAYLPFAALRPGREAPYLMDRYSLLHLPSAGALAFLRRSGGGVPAVGSRGGSTVFAPFPRTLPASVREVRAFRAALGGARVRQGTRATERALRDALRTGGIVHVATHGVMNPRNPMFSRVELFGEGNSEDDDGRLEVHEVLQLRSRASLVFLSGCETGVGEAWSTQFSRGEDYATLAQAFLFSGARSVVGTLWRLGDSGAGSFAERFYGALGTRSAPEALAQAQRETAADARFSHPFYWAGYQVFGGGDGAFGSHSPGPASVQQ